MFMETIEIPEDVWNPIKGLVNHGLFKNEISAIINIVHGMSLSKINEFESSLQYFETKYSLAFEDFEQQIEQSHLRSYTNTSIRVATSKAARI